MRSVPEDVALPAGAGRDRITACADEERVEVQPLDRTRRVGAVRWEATRAVVDREPRLVVREIVDASPNAGVPPWCTCRALLRDDVDDAVRGFCPIERRGARAL